MARVTGYSESKSGDGQSRTTTNYNDGSTRDVTYCKDGGITITDTDRNGNQKSGDGVKNIVGGPSRINTW
jgi:hypothetical protein